MSEVVVDMVKLVSEVVVDRVVVLSIIPSTSSHIVMMQMIQGRGIGRGGERGRGRPS